MTRKEIFHSIIEKNKLFLSKLGVISIGIFGSVVRGEDTKNSDYDILVEFKKEKKTFKSFDLLCDFFEKYIGSNFELITKDSLSKYIAPHILKEVENVKITN